MGTYFNLNRNIMLIGLIISLQTLGNAGDYSIKNGFYGETLFASDVANLKGTRIRNIPIKIFQVNATDTVLIDSMKSNKTGFFEKEIKSGSYLLCDSENFCTHISVKNNVNKCNWIPSTNSFRWTCGVPFDRDELRKKELEKRREIYYKDLPEGSSSSDSAKYDDKKTMEFLKNMRKKLQMQKIQTNKVWQMDQLR